ncbi:hypothetical protein HMN09_00867800 [Mycena chlorophos]|uniref:SAM domain-containing protein n=1 Tax=Mycena chlorophos TaxID=658473 RepID=A0A8H6W2A1_MYCCL|nr:hypothetical protein HMN09_00867800 [Mycena chlorophos]
MNYRNYDEFYTYQTARQQEMQRGLQQPQNPAPERYATAQYLLGMTNAMPPVTQPTYAAAQMRHMLDSGYFDGTRSPQDTRERVRPATQHLAVLAQTPMQPGLPAATQGALTVQRLSVTIPTVNPHGGKPLNVTLNLDRGMEPGDFLARVQANMGTGPDIALGWKSSKDGPSDPANRLLTASEAKKAIDHVCELIDNPRRTLRVGLRIIDPRPAPEKATKSAKEPKETEVAIREELALVKTALHCEECTTGLCFRKKAPNGDKSGPHNTSHAPKGNALGSALGALLKTIPTLPRDCSIPPNTITFDTIVNPKERRQRTSRPGASVEVKQPDIHIHLADGPLGPAFTNHVRTGAPRSARKHARDEGEGEDEDEQVPADGYGEEIVPISTLINELDAKMPASNFSRYAEVLERDEIHYCHQLVGFSEAELREIGVSRGSVKDLLNGARKALHAAKKRRVADKENVVEIE